MSFFGNSKEENVHKTRVGVLRGGPSSEYEVSLKTGATVLEHLPRKYNPIDIYIDRNGKWHLNGVVSPPEKILKQIDIAFNAMHGEYGEDGKVQKILESFNVPYTGSASLPSALTMNKFFAREYFKKAGLKIPEGSVLKKEEKSYIKVFEIFSNFKKPLVVKPMSCGSSVGVSIVENFENFTEALEKAFKYSPAVLIEEYIKGKEATCGVMESLNDNSYQVLPPIEIRPTKSSFFDLESKYDGSTEEICPGEFSDSITEQIQDIAAKAHDVMGLRHYSRADMIVRDDGEIYLLETNSLPGLTPESLLPKSLKASGYSLTDFIDHVITLAIARK